MKTKAEEPPLLYHSKTLLILWYFFWTLFQYMFRDHVLFIAYVKNSSLVLLFHFRFYLLFVCIPHLLFFPH